MKKNLFTWLLIVTLIWAIYPATVFYFTKLPWINADFLQKLGPLGDSFGVINSLFTGGALAAIVVAIFIQSKQLERQDEELRLYKEEMDRTSLRIQKEDKLTILKLKMDVAPQICRRLECRVKKLLPDDWDIDDRFSESPVALSLLSDRVEKRLKELDSNLSHLEEQNSERQARQAQFSEKISSMTPDQVMAYLEEREKKGEKIEVGFSATDPMYLINKERLLNQIMAQKQAAQLLSEILTLQEDLDSAYLSARELAQSSK
jgi:hypothetical protein